jgi:putative aldouronate transport system permease protein
MTVTKTWSAHIFTWLNAALLCLLAALCLLPMLHILAVSFSDRAASIGGFVTLWPINITVSSYQKVLAARSFLSGLRMSLLRTVLGAALMMVVTVLTAYPLSRPARQLRGRSLIVWLMLFAMVFNGGLIPFYLVVRNLGLLDTVWALVLPFALPIWNVIILINFFRETPPELEDAAVMDGASHWQLLWHVYLPLSVPALATITLFSAVYHWNEFFFGMIFMTSSERYPLQSFLRQVVILQDMSQLVRDPSQFSQFSDRSLRAATIFVTTIPILVVYPFVQRYFVAGVKLGAVKG